MFTQFTYATFSDLINMFLKANISFSHLMNRSLFFSIAFSYKTTKLLLKMYYCGKHCVSTERGRYYHNPCSMDKNAKA